MEFLDVAKGIMLTEGATSINGERVFRSYNKDLNLKGETISKTDNNTSPGHEFPSSLYNYKLNGNYIAQIAAVLGITELEICKIIDKNQLGREELINRFYFLTGNKDEFETIEKRMDLVATIFRGVLNGLIMNQNTKEMCDFNIIYSQRMLANCIFLGFEKGSISRDDFVWRIERFSKFLTKPELRSEIINKMPEEIKNTI